MNPVPEFLDVPGVDLGFFLLYRRWVLFISLFRICNGRLATLLQAVQERWNYFVSCPHRPHSSDAFIQLEEGSSTSVWTLSVYFENRHILVECNHFAQERKDIFGWRDMVESFRFHPTLILFFLKQILNHTNCDMFILYSSLHCIL